VEYLLLFPLLFYPCFTDYQASITPYRPCHAYLTKAHALKRSFTPRRTGAWPLFAMAPCPVQATVALFGSLSTIA